MWGRALESVGTAPQQAISGTFVHAGTMSGKTLISLVIAGRDVPLKAVSIDVQAVVLGD